MDARFVLESVLNAEFNLCREAVATRVDGCADDGGEMGIDESLAADNGEDTRSLRISCSRPMHAEEVASPQTSAW